MLPEPKSRLKLKPNQIFVNGVYMCYKKFILYFNYKNIIFLFFVNKEIKVKKLMNYINNNTQELFLLLFRINK